MGILGIIFPDFTYAAPAFSPKSMDIFLVSAQKYVVGTHQMCLSNAPLLICTSINKVPTKYGEALLMINPQYMCCYFFVKLFGYPLKAS